MSELAFSARTRLRAMGYWLREKAQIAWPRVKQGGGKRSHWWSRRSRGTKIRIGAVAGVVVLYLIIKFLPVPGRALRGLRREGVRAVERHDRLRPPERRCSTPT